MNIPVMKWIYFDLDKGVYVLNDPSEYLTANPTSRIVEVQVLKESALASGIGLEPSEIPLVIKQDGLVYQLSIADDYSLSVSRSGSTLVESFLPLSGGQMTGVLSLYQNPTTSGQAATKYYADTKVSLTEDQTVSGVKTFANTTKVKTHTAYSGSDLVFETGAVTTSGAVNTNIFTIPITEGSAHRMHIKITAQRLPSQAVAIAYNSIEVLFYRPSGGSPIQVGAADAITRTTGTGAGNYNVNLNIVSNNIEIQVTGVTAHTTYWVGSLEHQKVINSS